MRLTAHVEVQPLDPVTTPEEAWALLPARGEGVVTLTDRVVRFDPDRRTGLLLEAEVCEGASTVVVRLDGAHYRAWRWLESPGDAYRVVEHVFRSSERAERAPHLVYRHYWHPVPDDGVEVWTPLGARFNGFGEEDA